MRIGVVILPQFPAAESVRRWKALEDMGFAHGWCYDHLAWRDLADEPWYSTVTTLTIAATATSTLRLGTWVASPNFRHPVPFAKDLMSLAALSGDRIIGVIGAGGLGWDSAVLGQSELPPKQRVDRLEEFLELTDLLLTQPETSWRGTYYAAVRARMHPAGSRPRIPIVVAAGAPRGVRLAARYDGWATTGPAGEMTARQWWSGLADLVDRFEQAATSGDRNPAELNRYLSLDSMPGYSFTDFSCFTDTAGRAAELGFTDGVVHWPRQSIVYVGDEQVLGEIGRSLRHGEI